MSARIREHIRSNVYGIVAVFIALGGTAIAADGPLPGQNKVGSADIINGEVKGVDVGASQIAGSDVAADTLTGADISEADLDPTVLQRRVGSACVAGQAIRAIDQTGQVTCEAIGGSAPTGPAGGSLAGTYPNPTIAAGAVASTEVSNNTLTGTDINETTLFNDDSLTALDLAADSIDDSELAPAAFSPEDIVPHATTGNFEIPVDAINGAEIENDTVIGTDINESTLEKVPDANRIDNIDSADLVIGRSDGSDEGECTGQLPGTFETCADVTVTLPHFGRVLLLGTGTWHPLSGTDASSAICKFFIDDVEQTTPMVEAGGQLETNFGVNYEYDPVTLQMLTVPLASGAHDFAFRCMATITESNDIDNSYISAIQIGSG